MFLTCDVGKRWCGGGVDAATNLSGVTNQSLSCPSFCHGVLGRAQAVLQQCLAAAAAARERCRTISSRWTLGVSCLPCDPPYEGIVFSPISVKNVHPCKEVKISLFHIYKKMQKRIYQIRTQCQSSSQRDISMVFGTDILQKHDYMNYKATSRELIREI